MNYYKIDVTLNNGEIYDRVLVSDKDASLEEVKLGVLKDVFFKIESGDLERVESIDFNEISLELFDILKKSKKIIFLILDNNGDIKRPLITDFYN